MQADRHWIGQIEVTAQELGEIQAWAKNPDIDTWSSPRPHVKPPVKLPEGWLRAVDRHNQEVLRARRATAQSLAEAKEKGRKASLDRLGACFAAERARIEGERKRCKLSDELDALLDRGAELQERAALLGKNLERCVPTGANHGDGEPGDTPEEVGSEVEGRRQNGVLGESTVGSRPVAVEEFGVLEDT